jgi:hypothetical protein
MKEIVEHQHMVKPYLVYSMPWSIQSKMYGFFHFLYKRKKLTFTIIKPKWRLYQATEVVPSCVTRGTCMPNMLPGRPISGGSVLNGQVQDAEEALALHFRMKIQCLGSHTITLPVIQASSTQQRNAMKDLATNTRDKPSQIFAQVVSQCDDNVHALLPREENTKRTIRYQRPTLPVPAIYADVRLPEEYTTTTNNLQYENGQNAENRMLFFYSPDILERLANAQTFSVAPHTFKQLYTIRVPFKDVTGTAVYAFLPNKCQDTYRELFQSIVDNCHASNLQFNVQTVKMQSFVQLQLYLVTTSTTRTVSTT